MDTNSYGQVRGVYNCFFRSQSSRLGRRNLFFRPPALTTAIIVLHQLPETPETLWLRLLGRGGTRSRAIDEFVVVS
jgi:hypothetical protein